jgi:hypothetical protein
VLARNDFENVSRKQRREPTFLFLNQGYGCPLSPTLFNVYINEVIKDWNQTYTKGINVQNNTKLNTILFADDQVIIASSEDNLQHFEQIWNDNFLQKIQSNGIHRTGTRTL